MDEDDENQPSGTKRRRGLYKQYNEPGQPLLIPKSTFRSRKKAARVITSGMKSTVSNGPIHNTENNEQGTSRSPNPSSTRMNANEVVDRFGQTLGFADGDGKCHGGSVGDDDGSSSAGSSIISDHSTKKPSHQTNDSSSEDQTGCASESDNEKDIDFSDNDIRSENDDTSVSISFQETLCFGACVCGGLCINKNTEPPSVNDVQNTEQTPAVTGDPITETTPSSSDSGSKYNWDEKIHPSLSTTRFEVFLMIFHLFLRHRLTYAAVENILQFVNVLLGSSVLKSTEYIFRKLFNPKCEMLTHFYCPKCQFYLGDKRNVKDKPSVKCSSCSAVLKTKKDFKDSYFVTINVRDLLKYLLQRPNLKLVNVADQVQGVYSDICCGELYKEKILSEILNGKNCLSLTFNTDGAKVFRSRKISMWPIQFIVNEIVPEERFKDENVFLSGLWFGKGAPNMSTFLKPFVDELAELGTSGMEVKTPSGTKLYHIYAPLGTFDSMAKPKVLNMKGHNGKCGCSYCKHPNLPVEGQPAQYLRYITRKDGIPLTFENRNHNSTIEDMLKADDLDRQGVLKRARVGRVDETADHVNGFYGIACVAGLPKFDVVYGIAIDYLHTVLLGVMGTLLKFWFDNKHHSDEQHDPSSEVSKMDEYLTSIRPPQCMATASRALSERSDWKGKELRLFAIFYSLPCLENLQKFGSRQFKHFQKFVVVLQIFLGSTITEEQLCYAERLIDEFVNEYEDLYGSINMTINIHLLKHVTCIVRKWGPLWNYSNFVDITVL